MSLIGALTKAAKAGEAAKKTAPFYSAVDEALANLKRPKGTGIEFLTEVMKQPGVKKAEIADRKLEQAFKAKGKMTKEEAEQVLKDNPPPKLQEREYNEKMVRDEEDIKEELAQERYGRSYDELTQRQRNPIYDEAQRIMEEGNGTMYADYKTPGGQNYREILLKLPTERPNAANYSDPAKYDADLRAFNASGKKDYQSSHWKEDPNVLAHMRVQDRTGPNGEKILHVEEIQSDWHQAGRKIGYKNEERIKQAQLAFDEYNKDAKERLRQIMLKEAEGEMKPENAIKFVDGYLNGTDPSIVAGLLNEKPVFNDLYRTARDADKVGVPDAPFKKNWHELAMKRLLNYAADNGYDSIAITPGVEQADRYKLSKHIDSIMLTPNQYGNKDAYPYYFKAFDKYGNRVADDIVNEDKLVEYIGKEPAKQLLSAPANSMNERMISGADIVTGGEGMRGFYDKILPDYLNAFGKPYGAKLEMESLPVSKREPMDTSWSGGQGEHPFITSQDITEPYDGMVDLLRRNEEGGEHTLVGTMLRADAQRRMAEELQKLDKVNQIKLHTFPITPEMRESIKQKGLPLYQQIGIPTAGAGAASQVPEEPEYQAGGIAKLIKKSAPIVKAPEIIKPSGLTEFKNIVQQEKGNYGARRLERAADEIPNLEKMYQEKALREAFLGDNAKALMTMSPADFEKYAAKLPTLNIGGLKDDYINYLRKLPEGFRDVPFLEINKREQGASMLPFISGHEGRHRSRALTSNQEPTSLVRLMPRSELREPFPRRSQEEYIEAMKRELELTGNKVKPEPYTELDSIKVINRPPIDLPDIYAKGGSVKRQVKKADGGAINYNTAPDMSDGGRIIQGAPFKRGGKVKLTSNRDTMFMELSNKKLKRK